MPVPISSKTGKKHELSIKQKQKKNKIKSKNIKQQQQTTTTIKYGRTRPLQ